MSLFLRGNVSLLHPPGRCCASVQQNRAREREGLAWPQSARTQARDGRRPTSVSDGERCDKAESEGDAAGDSARDREERMRGGGSEHRRGVMP